MWREAAYAAQREYVLGELVGGRMPTGAACASGADQA